MARVLSHPFRLALNGGVATVEEDSDAADRERIAHLMLTRRGERELIPGFGLTDPLGEGVVPAEVAAGVATFGPPVTVTEVVVRPLSDVHQAVEVVYE